jgi:hypothetical protein
MAYVEFYQPFPFAAIIGELDYVSRCIATHYYSNMALMPGGDESFAVRLRNMRSFAVAGHHRKEMHTHEPFLSRRTELNIGLLV